MCEANMFFFGAAYLSQIVISNTVHNDHPLSNLPAYYEEMDVIKQTIEKQTNKAKHLVNSWVWEIAGCSVP